MPVLTLRCHLLVLLFLVATTAGAEPLRFFAIGDLPYAGGEVDGLRQLLADAAAERSTFIVHVGDIKGGSQPCTDARIRSVADLFRALPVPVLYTPGDNEWTDCHRAGAGRHDPLERLATLRRVFYADPAVLHNAALNLVHPDAAYPELVYFFEHRVLFVLLHVVGSNNNYRPGDAGAMAEFQVRSAANRLLLERAVKAAKEGEARAMVLIFHANPLFDETGARRGFVPLKQDLRRLLAAYPGPVLLIHGDTHRFRFDRPLTEPDSGRAIARLQRLEVPGSPLVAGVRVRIDPDAAKPFDVKVVYPSGFDAMRSDL